MTPIKTVVVTGGGSGGHITPILAVARELKLLQPDIRIVYISQKGDGLDDVVAADPNVDEMYSLRAGKFRRYNGDGWRQILDVRTVLLNIRDGGALLIGLWQSFCLLRRIRPNIMFTRGSFVSVPVCLSGAVLRIPYVTHDSDAIPSLTNRIIARWARLHTVALSEKLYPYPIEKTLTVGVPISPQFEPVTATIQRRYRQELKLDLYDWVVLMTGGGLGARRLNTAVIDNAADLLARYPKLVIIHVSGRSLEAEVRRQYTEVVDAEALKRVIVKGFVTDMYRYSAAADVIIARAGATTLAEFAVQAKACIIVPNHQLTGGHQAKNTAAFSAQGAIIELNEDQITQELRLSNTVGQLLDSPAKLADVSSRLGQFAKPYAARDIANLLLFGAVLAPTSLLSPTNKQDV